MTKFKAVFGLALLTALTASSALHAAGLISSKQGAARVSFETSVMPPFAYTHFCVRYKDECVVRDRQFRKPRPFLLTPNRQRELVDVNKTINRSIAPKRFVADSTYDTWRIAPNAGDCNDFAITKRHELLRLGWPTRSLLLSEVMTRWGERHLVLLVRTDQQDLVLDNLNANIKPWSTAPYAWLRVQSPFEPALWSTVKAPSVS